MTSTTAPGKRMHLNKTEAQARADDIQVFRRELARLSEEGVLTLGGNVRASITAHHDRLLGELERSFDIDRDRRASQLSLGMRIASFLGALALAAAIVTLFQKFWGLLSTPVQVITLVGAALGSLLLTEVVRRFDRSAYFCKLAALVAFACFVLNLSMLGQIFNITPSDKALLAWAALALLLAYRFNLRLLLVAGLCCIAAFIAARMGTWNGMYWLDLGKRPENFFPVALTLFVVPSLLDQRRYAGFAATYRLFALLVLFLPMLVLANWGSGSYLDWAVSHIENFYQILGFFCAAGVIALGVGKGWNEVVNCGAVFFVVFLYTKFYDWCWDWMPKYLFFLVIAMSAVVFLLVFQRLRRLGLSSREVGP